MIYITCSSGKYVYVPSRNVVIFTLSLRLQVNITTFLRGTYTYLPFGAGYVYTIFIIFSGIHIKTDAHLRNGCTPEQGKYGIYITCSEG